jgi:hypothetical protein
MAGRSGLRSDHVVHWVDGGETSLANTLLICSNHHKLLHEHGYTIRKNFEGNWSFRTGNGKVIPDSPMFRVDYYENPPRDGFEVDHEEHFVREPIPIYAVG